MVGYHWHHPLDPAWSTAEAAFLPDPAQRTQLAGVGWQLHRDTERILLAPYLHTAISRPEAP